MPNLSLYLLRRFGIAVFMYYGDVQEHSSPHIHVRYQEHWAVLRIPDGERLKGTLPGKEERRVRAWMTLNEDELMERWNRASTGYTITRID